MSVLLNRGEGRFRARPAYRAGRTPWSIAIGDLNGDGKRDLATANIDANTVSVFLNRGDGSFEPKHDYRTGAHPDSVAIGDLNHDGKRDLATANERSNTVSVLLNKGDGSFTGRVDHGAARYSKPASVVIGDLNRDRNPDLATANFEDTVSVFLNRGDGRFRASRAYRAGSGPRSIAFGDLNHDRRPDLVTANSNEGGCLNGVSVLLNRGDGTFRPKLDYRLGEEACLGFSSVAIGDLNLDGKPDVATANDPARSRDRRTVSVFVNKGDGRFRARFDYRARRPGGGVGAQSVAIRDLNGDRTPDLVTAMANSVSVLLNATRRR